LNNKLIFVGLFVYLKHDKNAILSFLENILEKPLEFGCTHETKTFFFIFEMRNFF